MGWEAVVLRSLYFLDPDGEGTPSMGVLSPASKPKPGFPLR